jgi:cold shock CspA family protein
MRGTVFHYDEDQDFGYINGADGKRYIFAREDLSHHVAPIRGHARRIPAG